MTFVAINVLTVPEGNGELLEQRFAGRAGTVERSDGFEHFELLRPVEGTDQYLVYTRWRDRPAFEAWTASRSFASGHAEASGRPADQRPAATGSTIWGFEVAQSASPVTD
jgi:heme oxygenase (mycobilin-producing)